jgi:hypothetical protein
MYFYNDREKLPKNTHLSINLKTKYPDKFKFLFSCTVDGLLIERHLSDRIIIRGVKYTESGYNS